MRNYKYKRLSKSDSEDEFQDERQEHVELMNRSGAKGHYGLDTFSKTSEYTLFEKPIHDGESLTSISLKYRISVAELKRVNRLQKETEFYALTSLKIPVKPNSVLFEMLQDECSSKVPLPPHSKNGPRISSSSELESEADIPVGVISISQICRDKNTRKEARQFLLNMQKDLRKLQQKTNSYKESLEEATTTLTRVSFSPMENKMLGCTDTDLSWWKVLAVGGIIVIGVPFVYLALFS